ncbi:TIGR03862 family flavoprotein [Ancylobacter sp. 6x-1]|uniref:TIGR03862 family flavoprotein n=1 Tax=Ancylobacter crimeensis TaxID=2579147 RepID=A0ABT0D6F4_9HYPH|nr:TIGR03862 family flavoprotein [Ancylobacter crimeensis]
MADPVAFDPVRPLVAVVGAGPAGLIAAETLAEAGCRVRIFERMVSPARKFLLAGRGGLNLTHSEPRETFLARYGAAEEWLAPLLDAFPPSRLRRFAEGLGEETFIGSSGRVFPKSFKASPLLRAWLRRLDGLGVTLETRRLWTGWDADGALTFADAESVPAQASLLALGGASWPRLGSDGGWVSLLAGRGVEIAPLVSANAGVRVAWSDILRERFAGHPLKRIAVCLGGVTVRGEAMITATGLEGGPIYALTAALRAALAAGEDATLTIDLRPDMAIEALSDRLAEARKGENQTNRLRKAAGLEPAAIGLLREAGPPTPYAWDLAASVKRVKVKVEGISGLERAISSAGGIARGALDDGSMLRALPGVFAAGEMLDWEAPTGGYLLQASFATGYHAACGMLRRLGLKEPARWEGGW